MSFLDGLNSLPAAYFLLLIFLTPTRCSPQHGINDECYCVAIQTWRLSYTSAHNFCLRILSRIGGPGSQFQGIKGNWYLPLQRPLNSNQSFTVDSYRQTSSPSHIKMSSEDSVLRNIVRRSSLEYANRDIYPNLTQETTAAHGLTTPPGKPYPFFVASSVKSTLGSPVCLLHFTRERIS